MSVVTREPKAERRLEANLGHGKRLCISVFVVVVKDKAHATLLLEN